jgi:hypothetical protein
MADSRGAPVAQRMRLDRSALALAALAGAAALAKPLLEFLRRHRHRPPSAEKGEGRPPSSCSSTASTSSEATSPSGPAHPSSGQAFDLSRVVVKGKPASKGGGSRRRPKKPKPSKRHESERSSARDDAATGPGSRSGTANDAPGSDSPTSFASSSAKRTGASRSDEVIGGEAGRTFTTSAQYQVRQSYARIRSERNDPAR